MWQIYVYINIYMCYKYAVQYDRKFPIKLDALTYCRQACPAAEIYDNIRVMHQGPSYGKYGIKETDPISI